MCASIHSVLWINDTAFLRNYIPNKHWLFLWLGDEWEKKLDVTWRSNPIMRWGQFCTTHYNDVIMGTIASQITSLTIVYSTVYSRRRSKEHQSSASLTFVRGIHRGPVKFPAQRTSNVENVSIWWRHHDPWGIIKSLGPGKSGSNLISIIFIIVW